MTGKYSSNRDSFLHWACTQEWANESDGNVEAPSGYFWRIEFEGPDVAPINGEFNSLLEEWLELEGVTDSEELRNSLVGAWIVSEDSNGLVVCTHYSEWFTAKQVFDQLQEIYAGWEMQTELEED